MDPSVVLITGASSGIGLACATLLAAQGADVVGASRRTTPDTAWASIAMDVDDDASVTGGVEQVVRDHGGIDAVVTCAGWGLAGPVETTPVAVARAQLDTNFFGTARVVAAALPSLREHRGRIVLIGSIGGVIGLPFQAYYSASKFALEGWAEALAWELKPHHVPVTLVEPGNFHTGFTGARRSIDASPDGPYAAAAAKAISTMERDELHGADPAGVAKVVAKLLSASRPPRRVSVGPPGERIGIAAKRFLPNRLFEAAAASSLGI
jgi:NAD(P)-dependent dehydrogenase (short-subunit alcohol dehydrogenase family)